jgi:hypothetical protein
VAGNSIPCGRSGAGRPRSRKHQACTQAAGSTVFPDQLAALPSRCVAHDRQNQDYPNNHVNTPASTLAGAAFGLRQSEDSLLRSLDSSNVLMQGMLSLLLFAGALHVDLSELKDCKRQVGTRQVSGGLPDLMRGAQ